jgi:hypothetical protein
MNQVLVNKVTSELEQLSDNVFSEIFTFVISLQNSPHGVPGKSLLKFSGSISADDAEHMLQAVEQDCRRIDFHEW